VLIAGLTVLAGGAVAAIAGAGSAVVVAIALLLRARKVWWKRHGPQALWPDRSAIPVSHLPTSALANEWRRTSAAWPGQVDARTRQVLVQRRQEVLDELERRDPIGFARWLAAGASAAGDPAPFMQGDGADGTDAFGGQQ
jgi:hypothetical protein